MSAIDTPLPTVLDQSALIALADRVEAAASMLDAGMADAADRWARLPEVFDVAGADGAYALLSRPRMAAQGFKSVIEQAAMQMRETALNVLPPLRARRDSLAERIDAVGRRLATAIAGAEAAELAYAAAGGDGATSEAAAEASRARTPAWNARAAAESAVGDVEHEITRLRRDIEDAENDLASILRRLSGGDEVGSPWGGNVGISQDHWGASSSSYPGGSTTAIGLVDRLTASLSDASARRISWMGQADRDDVRAWVDGHPDFAAAVGMVDPERAHHLWKQLEPTSVGQLFSVAPFAIGNLNGIAASTRDRFNRESLRQMLADDDLRDDYRGQLERLEEELDKPGDVKLLSLFAETVDGSPRASIGWGDLDGADQITTLTHGIGEDLAMLEDWSGSASAMQEGVAAELRARDSSATTATVLFMEWDSGWIPEVEHIERPDNGAVRLSHLLNGFRANSPDAQLDLALHSLGTTMGTQMIADHPGLVRNAWLYGSAGINGQTAHELERQMAEGTLVVHATYAQGDGVFHGDRIAPVGRMGEHPVDPADIPLVRNFSSEGGLVGDPGCGEPVITARGAATDGHNSQRSDLPYYRMNPLQMFIDPGGALLNPWRPPAVGYLDPASQSFKQSVVGIADSVVTSRMKTQ